MTTVPLSNRVDTPITNQELAKLVVSRLSLIDHNDMVSIRTDDAVEFLDAVCDGLEKVQKEYNDQLGEIQDQKDDLEHMYLAQKLNGEPEELLGETTNSINDIVILRRTVKDAAAAMRVIVENLSRTRGFVRNMGTRAYTPKSSMYSNVGRIKANIGNPKVSDDYRHQLSARYLLITKAVQERLNTTSDRAGDGDSESADRTKISSKGVAPIDVKKIIS